MPQPDPSRAREIRVERETGLSRCRVVAELERAIRDSGCRRAFVTRDRCCLAVSARFWHLQRDQLAARIAALDQVIGEHLARAVVGEVRVDRGEQLLGPRAAQPAERRA